MPPGGGRRGEGVTLDNGKLLGCSSVCLTRTPIQDKDRCKKSASSTEALVPSTPRRPD